MMRRKICYSMPSPPFYKSVRLTDAAACIIAALSLSLVLLSPVLCTSGEFNEYQIKAGFIFNLVQFTDWPDQSLAKTAEIRVCTLGTDPFDAAFQALNGKVAKGKPIAITHLEQIEDIEGCHVLFIGASKRKQISRILKYVKNAPILTVSEVENFPESGGMVNLLLERNKTVLEINNAAVHKNKLKISSQVLKLARLVTE